MTREEAIADIRDNIKPVVGGKSLDMAIESLTAISKLSQRLKSVNRYEMDEKVLIGFNMAVAIFNECFGEICALKNEQPEQNVGMCQQNVGKMSEKQTDGDLISRQAVINALCALCDIGGTLKENPWIDNPHIDAVIETIEQIPSAENTAEWIPVSERLPEVMDGTNGECSDDVLICVADDENITISTGFYGYYPRSTSRQGWWSMWAYGCHQLDSRYKVIAWMPLPEWHGEEK